jgi:hypothetical protein
MNCGSEISAELGRLGKDRLEKDLLPPKLIRFALLFYKIEVIKKPC